MTVVEDMEMPVKLEESEEDSPQSLVGAESVRREEDESFRSSPATDEYSLPPRVGQIKTEVDSEHSVEHSDVSPVTSLVTSPMTSTELVDSGCHLSSVNSVTRTRTFSGVGTPHQELDEELGEKPRGKFDSEREVQSDKYNRISSYRRMTRQLNDCATRNGCTTFSGVSSEHESLFNHGFELQARSKQDGVAKVTDQSVASSQNFVRNLEMFVASVDKRPCKTAALNNVAFNKKDNLDTVKHLANRNKPISRIQVTNQKRGMPCIHPGEKFAYAVPQINPASAVRNIFTTEEPMDLSVKKDSSFSMESEKRRESGSIGFIEPRTNVYIDPATLGESTSRSSLAMLEQKFGAKSSILNDIGSKMGSLRDQLGVACGGNNFEPPAGSYRNYCPVTVAAHKPCLVSPTLISPALPSLQKLNDHINVSNNIPTSRTPLGGSNAKLDLERNPRAVDLERNPLKLGALPQLQQINRAPLSQHPGYEAGSHIVDFWKALAIDESRATGGGRNESNLKSPAGLRCLECQTCFLSLQELTIHMIRTEHYLNLICAQSLLPRAASCASSLASSDDAMSPQQKLQFDSSLMKHSQAKAFRLPFNNNKKHAEPNLDGHFPSAHQSNNWQGFDPCFTGHNEYNSGSEWGRKRSSSARHVSDVSELRVKKYKMMQSQVKETRLDLSSTEADKQNIDQLSNESPLSSLSSSSVENVDFSAVMDTTPQKPVRDLPFMRTNHATSSALSAQVKDIYMQNLIAQSLVERAKLNMFMLDVHGRLSNGYNNTSLHRDAIQERPSEVNEWKKQDDNSSVYAGRTMPQVVQTQESVQGSAFHRAAYSKAPMPQTSIAHSFHSGQKSMTASSIAQPLPFTNSTAMQSGYVNHGSFNSSDSAGMSSALASLHNLVYGSGSRSDFVSRPLSGNTMSSRVNASPLDSVKKNRSKQSVTEPGRDVMGSFRRESHDSFPSINTSFRTNSYSSPGSSEGRTPDGKERDRSKSLSVMQGSVGVIPADKQSPFGASSSSSRLSFSPRHARDDAVEKRHGLTDEESTSPVPQRHLAFLTRKSTTSSSRNKNGDESRHSGECESKNEAADIDSISPHNNSSDNRDMQSIRTCELVAATDFTSEAGSREECSPLQSSYSLGQRRMSSECVADKLEGNTRSRSVLTDSQITNPPAMYESRDSDSSKCSDSANTFSNPSPVREQCETQAPHVTEYGLVVETEESNRCRLDGRTTWKASPVEQSDSPAEKYDRPMKDDRFASRIAHNHVTEEKEQRVQRDELTVQNNEASDRSDPSQCTDMSSSHTNLSSVCSAAEHNADHHIRSFLPTTAAAVSLSSAVSSQHSLHSHSSELQTTSSIARNRHLKHNTNCDRRYETDAEENLNVRQRGSHFDAIKPGHTNKDMQFSRQAAQDQRTSCESFAQDRFSKYYRLAIELSGKTT